MEKEIMSDDWLFLEDKKLIGRPVIDITNIGLVLYVYDPDEDPLGYFGVGPDVPQFEEHNREEIVF